MIGGVKPNNNKNRASEISIPEPANLVKEVIFPMNNSLLLGMDKLL